MAVCSSHSLFRSDSLITVEVAVKAVLDWYSVYLEGGVSKEKVKNRLLSLYRKHFSLAPILTMSDEALFIFLTFMVYRLDVPVEAEVLNTYNMMELESKDEVEEMTDIREEPTSNNASYIGQVPGVNVTTELETAKKTITPDAKTIEEDVKKISKMQDFFDPMKNNSGKRKSSFLLAFLEHAEKAYLTTKLKTEKDKWANVFKKIYYEKKSRNRYVKDAIADVLSLHYPKTSVIAIRGCTDGEMQNLIDEFFVKAWGAPPGFFFRNRACQYAAMSYLAFRLPDPAQKTH